MQSKSIIERGMEQWRIVVTICAILVGFGGYSLMTMQRQEFPDFTIRQGIVVGVMPGATSKEVEERLTRPVEDFLFSFNEVDKKKTYSVSKEGQVVVFVELGGEIKGQEAPAFWAKLRHGLNELKAQKLPGQVLALIGNNDFGDTSALLFTVVAEGRSPRDLEKYIEVLQSHLRRIDATSKLRTYGAQQEVIRVTISRERLARYGIRPAMVWASLQGLGGAPAPARLDTDELEIPIHVSKALRSEAELGDTILLSIPTGQLVRLKDVAEIKREYGHDDAYVRFDGKTAMVLSIEMQSGHDITRFGDQVERALDATRRELPPGVTITRVADQPQVVRTSVGHFLRDFGLAIAAVILVTMLLLPVRVAAVAAISIPLSIAITLGVLNALGVQLQTVSLAGLIVVLGMVVDNAIVVIDDHVDKLDRGLDPWTAAWKSARELAVPVFTATVAIILSYSPLTLFLTGMEGDFVGSLPLTIAVALVTSMAVAVLLIPVMNWQFIRRGLHRNGKRRSILDRLQGVFDRSLEAAFRHRGLTLVVGAAAVLVALVIAAALPQQMFPKVDRNQFAVEVYLPNGRSLKQTDAVIRRLEAELLGDKRVMNVTAFVGQSSPRFHTAYAPHMPARNYGQLLVNTVDAEATVEVLRDSQTRLSGAFPEAWVQWRQLELSLGNPIEVRLSGADLAALKDIAAKIKVHAQSIPGTTWVRDDYEDALPTIDVVPDADACARLGIPPAMLQMSLALGSQGFPVGTLWEDEYPIRILLQDVSEAATSIEGLSQQYVSSAVTAVAVPLEQLASLRPAWNEGAIVRRNGVQTLTVSMDVGMGVLASEVQKQVEQYVKTLDLAGVRLEYGGQKELAGRVFTPMTISMVVSIVLIFLVLLCQFQRFRRVLVTMLAMPLSLPGAFLGLLIMGYPFGLTAFIGIIGLLGIVVPNGIILVTYAEELRRDQGLGAREAGLAAGKRRMRPIYLTSMAAAVGVVPMILSRSTLWGPLGTVTCFGLLFGMLLTLFVLPVAYSLVAGTEKDTKASQPLGGRTAAVGLLLFLVLSPALAQAQGMRLSLEECRTLTVEQNAQVREAEHVVEAARETSAAVFTKYFPQVSASIAGFAALDSLLKIHTPGGNLPVYDGNPANLPTATEFAYMPPGSIEAADNAYMLSLTAVQPVYAGGRILNGNRLAELGVEAARRKVGLARRDAVAESEEKYWRIVSLNEKLKTLDSADSLLEALEREARDAVASGLITRNDELKVALQRRQLEVDRRRLENGIALATEDLRRHLRLPKGTHLILTDTLAAVEDPAALADERLAAVERRPETALLQLGVAAARLQTSLKLGEMLPTVSVGTVLMRYDVAGLGATNNVLGFGMASIPISGIWEGLHSLAAQEEEEEIAEQRLASTQELLALDAQKSWDALDAAWLEYQVAGISVTQAEVNLSEASDKYENGLETLSKVLEAQVQHRQATDRHTDAQSDFGLKRLAYLRSVGRGGVTEAP